MAVDEQSKPVEPARSKSRKPARRPAGVVGIGASAGGLEALQRLFAPIPNDSGLAYVVVQHLSPDHKSLMAELLGKHSSMPVVEADDGMRLAPDTVTLLPPGKVMTIAGGRLKLSAKEINAGVVLPIDIFFTSLAEDQRDRAIAVVLSGTGTDGSRGIQVIKQAGGMVIVQDPSSAKFDGMPRSAIATGAVDDIVPPEVVGPSILASTQARRKRKRSSDAALPAAELRHEDAMAEIMAALQRSTDVDFSHYKRSTLNRRIERRMHATQTEALDDYARLCKQNSSEVGNLYRELLIGVTRFFRDTDAFKALGGRVIPNLVERSSEHDPLRIWVCGCATGEEAYSVAILLAEEVERQRRRTEIKVFATDIDPESIEHAGIGIYDEAALAEVPPELVAKYFVQRSKGFQVARHLRQTVVFAHHNVLKDPPFTKLDLITCRNLLIYLEPLLQRKVLSRFHYALRSHGHLFLGSSESLGDLAADFVPVDARQKIFQVVRSGTVFPPDLTSLPGGTPPSLAPRDKRSRISPNDEELAIDQGLALLLEHFSPPALLVNERHEMLHVFGGASRFLQVPSGMATLDVLRLLPQGLSALTASGLRRALRSGCEFKSQTVRLQLHGAVEVVRLRIRSFTDRQGRVFVLIILEPQDSGAADLEATAVDLSADAADRIRSLEQELQSSRENLQATVEELETSNEELQAANEELIASNEELQSTNEELQSVNEELYTVNSEYEAKIEELTRLNDDLDNLLRANDVATLFLDKDLVIRRFTPAAVAVVNVMARDIGRSIAHISTNLLHDTLVADLREVLDKARPITREVRSLDGRWLLARITPYTTEAGPAEGPPRTFGLVVTFTDVTNATEAQSRLQAVLDSLSQAVFLVDGSGRITLCNTSWMRFALRRGIDDCGVGTSAVVVLRRLIADADTADGACAGLADVLAQRAESVAVDYDDTAAERRRCRLKVRPVPSTGEVAVSLVLVDSSPAEGGGE